MATSLQYSWLENPMNRIAWLSYSPYGGKELAVTEHTHTHTHSEYPSLVIKVVRYVQNYTSITVELIAGFLPTDTNHPHLPPAHQPLSPSAPLWILQTLYNLASR